MEEIYIQSEKNKTCSSLWLSTDRGAWRATVHRSRRVRHDWTTTPPPPHTHRAEKYNWYWIEFSPYTLDPHYDISTKWWFGIFLNPFSDREITTAHSIQGGMICSQTLCEMKCLGKEQRSFPGWGNTIAVVLEMWNWLCWRYLGKGSQGSFVGEKLSKNQSEGHGHVVGTPSGLASPFINNRLWVESSDVLR